MAGIALALQFDGTRVPECQGRLERRSLSSVPSRSHEVEEAITEHSLDSQTIAKAASAVMAQANPLAQNDYKVGLFKAAIQEELERASGKTI